MEVLAKTTLTKYDEYAVKLKMKNSETGEMETVHQLIRCEPVEVEVEADMRPMAKKILDVLSSGRFDDWYKGKLEDYLAFHDSEPEATEKILQKIEAMFDL